jgi:hypothetical protein
MLKSSEKTIKIIQCCNKNAIYCFSNKWLGEIRAWFMLVNSVFCLDITFYTGQSITPTILKYAHYVWNKAEP